MFHLQHEPGRLTSIRTLSAVQSSRRRQVVREMMVDMLEWVIVIEFDPLIRSLLQEWLEEIGVQALTFGSLEPLPEVVGAGLIIVDLGQVRQSHADVLRLFRVRYPGVPLMGLSTQVRVGMGADSALARQLGVEMILPKPCERQELLRGVLTLLGRRQG